MDCRPDGLSDQWTVGPMECRTNGLSDQWTVGLFKNCHCCHSSCCYSVDLSDQWTVGLSDQQTVEPMECWINGLSDQWTVEPIGLDCMAVYSLSLLPFILLLFSRYVGPMDCRINGLSDQWTVGPMDCRTNGLSDQRADPIRWRSHNEHFSIAKWWCFSIGWLFFISCF